MNKKKGAAAKGGVLISKGEDMDEQPRRSGFHPIYLFLVVPFVALLWVPFYNRIEPELFGIPFFYWYQMLWVIGGAILTAIVYFATND